MEYDVTVHCHHQKMGHVGFFQDAAAAYRIDRLYSGSDVLPPIDAACKMTPAN